MLLNLISSSLFLLDQHCTSGKITYAKLGSRNAQAATPVPVSGFLAVAVCHFPGTAYPDLLGPLPNFRGEVEMCLGGKL